MTETIKLQNIILPMDVNANFMTYPKLIVNTEKEICYDSEKKCHILRKYEIANFMTYYNCLQIARWKKYTKIDNVSLNLTFKGKISIEVYEIYRNSSTENYGKLYVQSFTASEKKEISIELPNTDKMLIGFRLIPLEDTEIYEGSYTSQIDSSELRNINISLATTTFKKQSYIKSNINMLKTQVLCDDSDLKGHLFVHVIDNERALNPADFDCEDLKIYPNPNVGGSGGFTRGMMEAMNRTDKPTHVLLMDDDVMIIAESLFRTYYLLRILKDEYTERFISGAMFDYDARERQYEDVGYVHTADGSYGPMKPKLNMDERLNVVINETFLDHEENNSYAGWWYCCIPTVHIERNGLPLPLFVRGDDVEFSLRNNPGFLTLNGIAIWHVGFAGKFNAAMELYQVHRNSLIIQAASDICRDVDFMARIKPMFWKEITRFAYNNAELLLDCIEDYLKGPEYLKTLNGEQCLKEHAAKNEKLIPVASCGYPHAINADPYEYQRLNVFQKAIYVMTINGHLLPNFMLRNHPPVISFDWFFVPGKNYMRKQLIALNNNDRTCVVRKISRKRCFALIKRRNKVMKDYKKNHEAIDKQYREHFEHMTTFDFWKEYLGI